MQQHAEFKESPLGLKVMAACKTQVEPVVKELKELINGVWQNQSKVDGSDEFFPRIASHTFEFVTPEVVEVVKRISGHEVLVDQLTFVLKFMECVKDVGNVQQLLNGDLAERKLEVANTDLISKCLSNIVDFTRFFKQSEADK